MILLLVVLAGLYIVYQWLSSRRIGRRLQPGLQPINYTAYRAVDPPLFCETCGRRDLIDDTAYCNRCGRTSPDFF